MKNSERIQALPIDEEAVAAFKKIEDRQADVDRLVEELQSRLVRLERLLEGFDSWDIGELDIRGDRVLARLEASLDGGAK